MHDADVPARLRLEAVSVDARLLEANVELREGDCCVVVGPNGAGKSTLLRLLAGLESPSAGRVLFDDRPWATLSASERAARVAWLPQRPQLGEALRVDELVASARYRFREAPAESLARARRALERVGASELAARRTDRISGGELQRALLATLLAQETPLLLVDEPANHLDPAHQVAVYRRLGDLWRRGLGLMIVTHDINLASFLGDPQRIRVLGIRQGRIVLESTLGSPRLAEELSALYSVPLRAVDVGGVRHLIVDRAPDSSAAALPPTELTPAKGSDLS